MNYNIYTTTKQIICLCIMLGCTLFVDNALFAQGEKIIVSDEIAPSGTQACVEVSVEGFTNVGSVSIVINTSGANIATYSAGANFVLPGLNEMNILDRGPFGLLLTWNSPDQVNGYSVPDGTVIFEYCFDIAGAPGDVTEVFVLTNNETFFAKINQSGEIPMIMDGSITIPDVPPLTVMEDDILPDNCLDTDNGEVQISVEGGTPPYNFSWSNMTSNEDLIGAAAGTYTVTVSDAAFVQEQLIMNYTIPADTIKPLVDVGTSNMITCIDDVITLGGNNTSSGAEFEYQWKGPAGVSFISGQDQSMAEVDTEGEYSLLVINTENGCTTEEFITVIADMESPNLDLDTDRTLTCVDGGIILEASNDQALPGLTSTWDPGTGSIDEMVDDLSIRVSSAGVYAVVLTNPANGCTNEGEITVSEAVLPQPMIDGEVAMLNCDASQVDIAIIKNDDHDVLWTTTGGSIESGADMSTITVSGAAIYIATVTDPSSNCFSEIEIEVTGDTSEPTVEAGDDVLLTCSDPETLLLGTTDSPDHTIEWTNEDGDFINGEISFNINRAGTYVLNVTNEFGCLRTDELVVTIDTMKPIADAGDDFELSCSGVASLDGSGSSSGDDFGYRWTTSSGSIDDGATTLSPTISSVGIYDLEVTDRTNGCSALSNVEVSLMSSLLPADGGADFSLCEDQTMLTGNSEDGITGMWTTTSSANIDNPDAESISISNLQAGENIFIWTLSADGCADYSTDSIRVNLESIPQAAEDVFSIPSDSTLASVNVLQNDNLSNNDGVTVAYQTMDPNFMDLGDGTIEYIFTSDSLNTFSFQYTVCSEVCPTLCDSTTVTINRTEPVIEPVDLDDLPNVITPNGDGLNDALVFDIMLINPDDFPNAELVVFNRWGDVVYKQRPYDNNWQGTNQTGGELPEGTYYFINRLSVVNGDLLTGDITIIRD